MTDTALEEFMADLTPAQRAAVISDARITVVPACPGSGKTKTFVARFAQELHAQAQSPRPVGVLAVSFTNTAKDEVATRLSKYGGGVTYPHFIGTIDAFLLKFIVRPFGGHLIDMGRFRRPIESSEYLVEPPEIERGLAPIVEKIPLIRGVPLHRYKLLFDWDSRKATVYVKPKFRGPAEFLERGDARTIFNLKQEWHWKKGIATFDDLSFIAAYTLNSNSSLISLLARRFPILLVDEVQDTGGAREACIRALLECPDLTSAFVVGDPDQCIMQFAHARAGLIKNLAEREDAVDLRLDHSFRFHQGIADVAAPLALHMGSISSGEASVPNNILLVTHTFGPNATNLRDIQQGFSRFVTETGAGGEAVLLAWNTTVVNRLRSGRTLTSVELGTSWGQSLLQAAKLFMAGDVAGAFRYTERIAGRCCGFPHGAPSASDLRIRGIDRRIWRVAIWNAMAGFKPRASDETLRQWVGRLQEEFIAALGDMTDPTLNFRSKVSRSLSGSPSPQQRELLWATPIKDVISESAASVDFRVDKVHRVKGREFPVVGFYVPKSKTDDLPVADGWFNIPAEEPGRIAYVAVTRAQKALIVFLHDEMVEEMSKTPKSKEFLDAFPNRIRLSDYLKH